MPTWDQIAEQEKRNRQALSSFDNPQTISDKEEFFDEMWGKLYGDTETPNYNPDMYNQMFTAVYGRPPSAEQRSTPGERILGNISNKYSSPTQKHTPAQTSVQPAIDSRTKYERLGNMKVATGPNSQRAMLDAEQFPDENIDRVHRGRNAAISYDDIRSGDAPAFTASGSRLSAKEFKDAGGAQTMPQIAHPYGYSSPTSAGRQAYDNANYRLGMSSPEAQRQIINDNRLKAAQGKLRIGSADGQQFGYKDMSPEAYRRMELERMGLGAVNEPRPLTQSQQYHADLKGKALPVRDNRSNYNIDNIPTVAPGSNIQYHTPMPIAQTKALGTNIRDPLSRRVNSDNNQTSETQVANNGNINNPKITNKPNANGSNGFF